MAGKVDILGVKFDRITMSGAIEKLLGFMEQGGVHTVFTPNSEMVQAARRDATLKPLLNSADLVLPDGIGVVYASRILKQSLEERVAGCDVVLGLMERMAAKKKSVFLFGAKPGVAKEAARALEKKYPGLVISGTHHGYFTDADTPAIIDKINTAAPDLLLVCLGFPKQERWIYQNKRRLLAKVIIGAGGTLDVLSGRTQRAPERWRRLGLEWLYRLKKEPQRLGRMMALPAFGFTVLFFRLFGRAYTKGEEK